MWRTRRRRTPVLLCSLFFALPPLTSFHPFSVSFFSLPLCLLLFFHEQYDAITGKNGKTFPPALVVFYNYPFPRLPFRPQVIVRDPLSLFFSSLDYPGTKLCPLVHARSSNSIYISSFQRMEQRKFVADDHCVRAGGL